MKQDANITLRLEEGRSVKNSAVKMRETKRARVTAWDGRLNGQLFVAIPWEGMPAYRSQAAAQENRKLVNSSA